MFKEWQYIRPSLKISLMALCAAIYSSTAYLTAYIVSPWGVGQFRPAVIIPLVFTVISGPFTGAFGGAIGTLIADSIKHGTIYFPSLAAAVPGHIIGFYLFGYLIRKFNWTRYVIATTLSLAIANAIVAFLYVPVKFGTVHIGLSLGLTMWWYITMLPFALFLGPPIIKAVAQAIPSLIPLNVRRSVLSEEVPKLAFSLSLLTPGLIMVIIGIFLNLDPQFIKFFITGPLEKYSNTLRDLIITMFITTGGITSVLGVLSMTIRAIGGHQHEGG